MGRAHKQQHLRPVSFRRAWDQCLLLIVRIHNVFPDHKGACGIVSVFLQN